MVAYSQSSEIAYPPAPWQLQGIAFVTYHWVDVAIAQSFIPSDLEVLSVFPGKTIGGTYWAKYTAGSILEYNELIVFPGFIRHNNRIGGWVSHIYVDSLQSVAGGREIWGLPKELAEFTWTEDSVTAHQGDRVLANLRYTPSIFPVKTWWKPGLRGDVFGGLSRDLLQFRCEFQSNFQLQKGRLTLSLESPFSALDFKQPIGTIGLRDLQAYIKAPEVVGTMANRP